MKETIILDITAGNRTMWMNKEPNVLYLDIEKHLEKKSDLIADSVHLPFKDCSVHVIYFDPPHCWRTSLKPSIFTVPNMAEYRKAFGDEKGRRWPRYYGWDKYRTEETLRNYLVLTLQEVHRVLKGSGLIIIRWSEIIRPLDFLVSSFRPNQFLLLFKWWVKSPLQTSKIRTFWLTYQKVN